MRPERGISAECLILCFWGFPSLRYIFSSIKQPAAPSRVTRKTARRSFWNAVVTISSDNLTTILAGYLRRLPQRASDSPSERSPRSRRTRLLRWPSQHVCEERQPHESI